MENINASDYGAKGNGQTDDTGALQTALDAAEKKGALCFLPAGHYRIDGSLVVPPGVTLAGASGGVPHSRTPIGTVLLAYGGRGNAEDEPLITLKYNATVRNLVIHYPEQTFPDIAPYPWTIRGDGMLCQVIDVVLTNPYQALDFGTHSCELHTVRNVFGQPLKTGVFIDQCYDIGRLENVHFNPNFWTLMTLAPGFPKNQAQELFRWLSQNLVGFKIGRTDWQYITNCFVIFPLIGFHFDDFGHGPGNADITQSGADICAMAVRVDQTQEHAGVQISNGQFMSTLLVGENNKGPVKLSNCGFWGVPETKSQVVQTRPQHAGAHCVPLHRLGCRRRRPAVHSGRRRAIDRQRLRIYGCRESSDNPEPWLDRRYHQRMSATRPERHRGSFRRRRASRTQ